MCEKQPRYLSYLLRLWRVQENEHTVWRASLTSSQTSRQYGFANLDAVYAFLRCRISEAPGSGGEAEAGTQDGRNVTEPTVQPQQRK